jgi:hypothetical protein
MQINLPSPTGELSLLKQRYNFHKQCCNLFMSFFQRLDLKYRLENGTDGLNPICTPEQQEIMDNVQNFHAYHEFEKIAIADRIKLVQGEVGVWVT